MDHVPRGSRHCLGHRRPDRGDVPRQDRGDRAGDMLPNAKRPAGLASPAAQQLASPTD